MISALPSVTSSEPEGSELVQHSADDVLGRWFPKSGGDSPSTAFAAPKLGCGCRSHPFPFFQEAGVPGSSAQDGAQSLGAG